MLNKIVRKSILKTKKLIIAIFLLFIVAQMLLIASQITYSHLENQVDTYLEEANIEDFRIYEINKIHDQYDKEWQKEFEKDFDVNLEENKYIYTKDSNDISYGILKYNADNTLNTIKLTAGDYPTEDNEILLDPEYMQRHDLSIGDEYKIKDKTYTISGSGYMPDFIYPMDLTFQASTLGDTDTFIPLYMNSTSFNKYGKNKVVNYLSGQFKKDVEDKKKVYAQMRNAYTYSIPYLDEEGNPQLDKNGAVITQSLNMIPVIMDIDQNAGMTGIKQELNGEQGFLTILSMVILIITFFVILILFNDIFASQKKEMGILKAEGILEKDLTRTYTLYLFIILTLSSIIGIYLGLQIKGTIEGFIKFLFSFPSTDDGGYIILKSIFISQLSIYIVVFFVYILSIRKNINKNTILLLKNIEVEKPPKIKLNKLTKNMKFLNKYKFNILFRNLKISLLLVFGVFISAFLLLMSGSMKTTFDQALNMSTNGTYTYEYMAVFSDGTEVPDYNSNSIITEATNVLEVTNDEIFDSSKASIKLFAYNFESNEYIHLKDGRQKLDEDKVYVSSLTAKIYGLEQGQYIKVANPYDMTKTINIRVDSIIDDPMHNQIYIDIDAFQEYFDLDDDYANTQVGLGDKEKEYQKYDEKVSYSKAGANSTNMDTTRKIINFMVNLISIVGIFISVITLVIITSIIISKNKKTISVMKVLGYTDKEINSMIIAPYKWILIVVYFVSIPAFKWLIQKIIEYAVADMDIAIVIKIPFPAIIRGFIAIFIIYIIALTVSRRGVKKISLAESLKTSE